MTHVTNKYLHQNCKPIAVSVMVILIITICVLIVVKKPFNLNQKQITDVYEPKTKSLNTPLKNITSPKRHRQKEIVYDILSNTSRTLIAMEIRARRLEDNIRRVRERTRTLLWKNKDKSLWKILFKNISRNVAIRHEFHEHSSLRRIMEDDKRHKHHEAKHDFEYKARANDETFGNDDYETFAI